ncbi:putative spermidine/putrescine transport system permease protein [Stella humosa]|uniref:Putative spermidine/putrescine transport system permease protein n=2 Tax=Stella humosa TaxID=94 RepID=A0A3N1M990_9PROT|nr:putative spermidine/putrescine transport system permease protein [Stella humosa]BBK30512.1 ABC transporter permease [Stella humosa]
MAGGALAALAARVPSGPFVLGLPALLFLLVIFVGPVLRLLLLSIEGGSLGAYEKALTDGLYLQVFRDTFEIAAIVTVFCALLGYPVAFYLTTLSRTGSALGFACILIPLLTSVLVRTYAWMVILGRNGIVNRTLMDWGMTDRPLALLHNLPSVIIGMTHVLLPMFILPVYSVMVRVDRELLRAADGLGASGWQVFTRVYLPLTWPGVLAGATLVFIISLGFYITPALLGGGRIMMIANVIEHQVQSLLDWRFAGALSMVLLVATLAVQAISNRVQARRG